MAQFVLYNNPNRSTKKEFPYLLDVQSHLLSDLETRVVVPVAKLSSLTTKPISNLCPIIKCGNEKLVLMTQQIAGIPINKIGKPIAELDHYRSEIISALDFLISGI